MNHTEQTNQALKTGNKEEELFLKNAVLKEYGSLDIEKIRNLPIEEKIKVLPTLTQEQKEEYWAKRPVNEGKMGTQPVYVDYPMEQVYNYLNFI